MFHIAICAAHAAIEQAKYNKAKEERDAAKFEKDISCLSDQDKVKARLEMKMHKERISVERERISAIKNSNNQQHDSGFSMSKLIFLSTLIK